MALCSIWNMSLFATKGTLALWKFYDWPQKNGMKKMKLGKHETNVMNKSWIIFFTYLDELNYVM
jgi:hypothetical protein